MEAHQAFPTLIYLEWGCVDWERSDLIFLCLGCVGWKGLM